MGGLDSAVGHINHREVEEATKLLRFLVILTKPSSALWFGGRRLRKAR
jgi:hypothetical protein